jgi:hypothetical protein
MTVTPLEAAEHMRLDAAFYRALADETRRSARPEQYGDRAQTYADGIAARIELIAEFVSHEALRQEAGVPA